MWNHNNLIHVFSTPCKIPKISCIHSHLDCFLATKVVLCTCIHTIPLMTSYINQATFKKSRYVLCKDKISDGRSRSNVVCKLRLLRIYQRATYFHPAIHMHTYIHIHTWHIHILHWETRGGTNIRIYLYTCTDQHINTNIHVHKRACMHAHRHTDTKKHTCNLYTYACMYVPVSGFSTSSWWGNHLRYILTGSLSNLCPTTNWRYGYAFFGYLMDYI